MTIKTVLTTIGRAKILNAITMGETFSITKMALGDGVIVPIESMAALSHEVWRGVLDSLEIDPENSDNIIARVTVPDDAGGWTVRECGLYDSNDFLIAIGNLAEVEKVPGYVSLTVTMVVAIGVSDISGITLTPAGPYIHLSEKGMPGGVATLDSAGNLAQTIDASNITGQIDPGRLPSYVDDVINVADYDSLPVDGEEGKIYITLDRNKAYRWTGSTYIKIADDAVRWFSDVASFPAVGVAEVIYVDIATPALYLWDGSSYLPIGAGGGGGIIPWDLSLTGTTTTTYPLDASAEELATIGAVKPTMSNGDQTGSIITAGAGSIIDSFAAPANITTQGASFYFNTLTGTKAVELQFALQALTTGSGGLSAAFTVYKKDLSDALLIVAVVATTAGVWDVTITANGDMVYLEQSLIACPSRIGITMEGGTNALSITMDGVPLVLGFGPGGWSGFAECFAAIQLSENTESADAGKTGSITVITDPLLWTEPFSPGATSIGEQEGGASLPVSAAPGSLLEVTVGGTYGLETFSPEDVGVVLADGVNVIRIPAAPASAPVTSVNGQTGDVVVTSPVTSVNGQTGDVYINVPAATTIDGTSGTIATKKRPAAFGMVFNTHYTLNGFTERHVVGNPAYSFSPGFNQGGGVATPKISADASWGLFRANRYTSNSSFVNELFAVDLFTGTTTRVAAGTGIHVFSAVASADGTTIYMGTTQAGEARAYKRNADGGYSHIGGFNTRYLTTDNRRIIRASDTQLGQATPTYIYAGYTLSTPSNVIIRATVSNWTTTPITISALANVRYFSVSPDSDHIFAKAIDGTVWMGKADGVTAVALPASISGTVLSAVFQRPGIHQSRINQYKMAVQWDDAGTIKLSIVDFEIGYGGTQIIYSYTHYMVDPGDLLTGGGFSVCGTYVSGEYKVIDVLTGTEVLNQNGEWIG